MRNSDEIAETMIDQAQGATAWRAQVDDCHAAYEEGARRATARIKAKIAAEASASSRTSYWISVDAHKGSLCARYDCTNEAITCDIYCRPCRNLIDSRVQIFPLLSRKHGDEDCDVIPGLETLWGVWPILRGALILGFCVLAAWNIGLWLGWWKP